MNHRVQKDLDNATERSRANLETIYSLSLVA